MLTKTVSALAMALLEWVVRRLESQDAARVADRDDDLRDRLRERMREYEDRARGSGDAGEDRS